MSEKMTEDVKDRLREIAHRKRKANPIAGDYEVTDWLIVADLVREEHAQLCDTPEDYFRRGFHPGRTLRYVPAAVIAALVKTLPHIWVRYRVGPGRGRTTPVFPNNLIVYMLDEMKLPLEKYSRYWDENNQSRCRTIGPTG